MLGRLRIRSVRALSVIWIAGLRLDGTQHPTPRALRRDVRPVVFLRGRMVPVSSQRHSTPVPMLHSSDCTVNALFYRHPRCVHCSLSRRGRVEGSSALVPSCAPAAQRCRCRQERRPLAVRGRLQTRNQLFDRSQNQDSNRFITEVGPGAAS